MSELSANRFVILAAVEATYGTDAVATVGTTATADIIHHDVRDLMIMPGREIFAPTRRRASAAGVAHVSFAQDCEVTCEIPMTGKAASGAGNEEPYYAPLLKAAGFTVAVVSDTSATYTLETSGQDSATIYRFQRNLEDANYRLQVATGVRWSATINAAVNEEASMSLEGRGLYTAESQLTDPAAFFNSDGEWSLLKDGSTSVTARTTGAEVGVNKTALGCKGITLTYNSVAMPVASIEINCNWTVDTVNTMQGSSTAKKQLLTMGDAARIEGSFDLQDGDAALEALIDAFEADTEAAISLVLTDGTDTITISMPKVQIGQYSEGSNGNVRTYTWPFFANGNWASLAGDNAISIAYT